jgi:hypothetical protein
MAQGGGMILDDPEIRKILPHRLVFKTVLNSIPVAQLWEQFGPYTNIPDLYNYNLTNSKPFSWTIICHGTETHLAFRNEQDAVMAKLLIG